MDHSFIPSQFNSSVCAKCKYDEISHTGRATCECCSNSGVMNIFTDMLMCSSCIEKEMIAINNHQTPDKQESRAKEYQINSLNDFLQRSRDIDDRIQIRQDIFNAQTIAIVELKTAIDADDSITNKPFALAEELDRRYKHLKQVIFEENEKQIERGNEQKAIQIYLNNLANQLRVEEREKLKLTDISYKPNDKKPVVKKINLKKFDKTELRLKAKEIGVPESVLQMIVVNKNMTIQQAAEHLTKVMTNVK